MEHGRGHVQRLLELAEQLLIAANIALSVEQRFVLVGSIWLHDLGHSGDSFSFEGKSGLVQNKDDKCSTGQFPVYGDPDHVRRYHNFLSYDLIKNHRTFFSHAGQGKRCVPTYKHGNDCYGALNSPVCIIAEKCRFREKRR